MGSEYRTNEIVSGVFIFLALLVFGLFAFKVGSFDLYGLLKGRALVCRAYFIDVRTVQSGAEVKVGGRRVGEVTGVRMVERPLSAEQATQLRRFHEAKDRAGLEAGMLRQLVELEFELFDPTLKLDPDTASVSLRQDSVLSAHFVDLDPGEWSDEGSPRTLFRAGFDGPQVITAREGTGIDELVALMRPVVQELDITMKTINEKVLTEKTTASLERIFENLDSTIENAREATREVTRLLDRSQDPRVHEIVDNLQRTTSELDARLDSIQDDLHRVLADTSGLLNENRAGVAEIVRRIQRAAWQAELALRKVRSNPSVLLFGDEETDFQAADRDDTDLRRRGRARPYQQRDEN